MRHITPLLLFSCSLSLLSTSAPAQGGLVRGEIVADWSATTLSLPVAKSGSGGAPSGNNYVDWEYFTDGRTCDGDAVAKSEQLSGSATEYGIKQKHSNYYREQWHYNGSLKGHLEGNPKLRYYGYANITKEDNGTNCITAAQAGGFASYESNTEPNPVFAVVTDAGRQSAAGAVASSTFSFSALFMSWSTSVNTTITNGFGAYVENSDDNDQLEFDCTDYFTFKTRTDVLIEVRAKSMTNDEWTKAHCYCWGDVKGAIYLSELPPEDC